MKRHTTYGTVRAPLQTSSATMLPCSSLLAPFSRPINKQNCYTFRTVYGTSAGGPTESPLPIRTHTLCIVKSPWIRSGLTSASLCLSSLQISHCKPFTITIYRLPLLQDRIWVSRSTPLSAVYYTEIMNVHPCSSLLLTSDNHLQIIPQWRDHQTLPGWRYEVWCWQVWTAVMDCAYLN